MQQRPKISIVAPAYNEEGNIGRFLDDCIFIINKLNLNAEVVIVEDGSKDKTKEIILDKVKKNSKIRIIEHEKNRGYKQSFIDCVQNALGDIIVTIDTDLQYDIKELPKFLEIFKSSNVDAVVGLRTEKKDSLIRKCTSKMFTLVTNIIFLSHFKDTNCIFRVFKKRSLDKIHFEAPTFQLPTEMLVKWKTQKIKMKFVKIKQKEREVGESTFKPGKLLMPTLLFLIKLRIKTIKYSLGMINEL